MKRLSYRLTGLLAASLLCTFAHAEEIPAPSPYDSRIRTVAYDRDNMVLLRLSYGQRTHIEFSRGEVVTYISSGDDPAWDIGPQKNIKNDVFLKPLGKLPETNMVIVTNKHTYNFVLDVVNPPVRYFADVRFTYPDEEIAKANAARAEDRLNASGAGMGPQPGDNTNYWLQGSNELAPSRVWDDGRFTYLVFPAGAQLPAFYMVGDDHEETIAHPSVDPKTGVISLPMLTKKIVLRRGDRIVACVFNKGYAGPGRGSPAGTTSDSVQRVIKGGEQ